MSPYLLLYILTRLDYVDNFLGPVVGASIIYLLFVTVPYVIYHFSEKPKKYSYTKDEDYTREMKDYEQNCSMIKKFFWPKTALAIIVLASIINFATPTKNEALVIIAGGKAIDFATNNESLVQMPWKAADIVVAYMDKTLEELKNETK